MDTPLPYMQEGRTVIVGQTNSYTDPASALLSTIEQDSLAEPTSKPVFLEPLVDAWNLDPQEVLAISQALASWGKTMGKKFVFTTPSELALTEEAHYQGSSSPLPRLNSQAVSGASLLRLPPAGQLRGYTVPTTSGPNLIANPSGQDGTTGWTDTAGTLSAETYQGSSDIGWSVPITEPDQVRAHTYPAVTDGDTYQFSVQVAGSGQVFMDVYNGSEKLQSPAINLGSFVSDPHLGVRHPLGRTDRAEPECAPAAGAGDRRRAGGCPHQGRHRAVGLDLVVGRAGAELDGTGQVLADPPHGELAVPVAQASCFRLKMRRRVAFGMVIAATSAAP